MTDFWNGGARWQLVRTITRENTGALAASDLVDGGHIAAVNGAWYLFSRKVNCLDLPNCVHAQLGTEVRKSLDAGATWSQPVDILTPTPGTAWSWAATDGDAYYDAVKNKWHYLFQCTVAEGAAWNGCHAERSGSDPMGPFVGVGSNPVIPNGSLWSHICDSQDDSCVVFPAFFGSRRPSDEGTFNIFNFDGSFFWISFHGYDGVRGYRGIAKTSDFNSWIAGDSSQGVPADDVLDLIDAWNWRESWFAGDSTTSSGPIGAGAGSIVYDAGYYYQIAEFGDKNLACTPGQNWDLGLFRSASLTNTTWEQYPLGNPIVYSSKETQPNLQTFPCNDPYPRLFKDPATNVTYMTHGRNAGNNFARYVYQLVWTTNMLVNGDLWRADLYGWQQFPTNPPANIAVYRLPLNSSDGNQYLEMNCGTYPSPCVPGESIYQDVPFDAAALGLAGHTLTFGGKFATDGGSGHLDLVVHQLDANGIITNSAVPVTAGPTYTAVSGQQQVDARTKTLRYQLYLYDSAVNFRADEMFLNRS